MNITLAIAMIAIVSYLLGGINGAITISRIVYHEDIRQKGSKNPGFTNFKRVYGFKFPTVIAALIDIFKTIIPVLVSMIVFRHYYADNSMFASENAIFVAGSFGAQVAGSFCMLGHAFPIWYKFKGGKTVLAGATMIWFVDWRMGLIVLAMFAIVLLTIKYMSLASITGAVTASICLIIFSLVGWNQWCVAIIAIGASILLIIRHHANIGRLVHGTESKFELFKHKSK